MRFMNGVRPNKLCLREASGCGSINTDGKEFGWSAREDRSQLGRRGRSWGGMFTPALTTAPGPPRVGLFACVMLLHLQRLDRDPFADCIVITPCVYSVFSYSGTCTSYFLDVLHWWFFKKKNKNTRSCETCFYFAPEFTTWGCYCLIGILLWNPTLRRC